MSVDAMVGRVRDDDLGFREDVVDVLHRCVRFSFDIDRRCLFGGDVLGGR